MTAITTPAEFVPATQSELARFMAENLAGPKQTICPVGGRTALHYGSAAQADVIVSLSELTRVIDYPARDMTITVEAGMRIAELQLQLAKERQRLPIDIAQPGRATLGGAVATNTSGSRRFGHGTFRENVAGYDICKLLVGSRGTLGIVTQITLKLRPLPETSSLVWFGFSSFEQIEQALQLLLKSESRPVAIDVLNAPAAKLIGTAARTHTHPTELVLCVGIEGSVREVDWQMETLRRELAPCGVLSEERISGPDANRLWEELTEFPTCADDPLTFQVNLLPSRSMEFASLATRLGVAVQVHAGNGIVIGQLPDEAASIDSTTAILNELRHFARSARGNLVVLHCDPEWKSKMPMCGDPEPSWGLMQKLKRQLDPHGLLNPGRFVDATVAG